MKRLILFTALAFICTLSSCDKNDEEEDKYYTIQLFLPRGADFSNDRIEYYVEYPNCIKLGEQAVLRVKAEAKSSNWETFVTYSFYEPSNGTITEREVPSDDSDVRIREYIFEPGSTGEAKIHTNARSDSDHITITVE